MIQFVNGLLKTAHLVDGSDGAMGAAAAHALVGGGLAVLRYGLQHSLAVVFTSLFGVSALLASLFLLFGDLSISELHQNGILQSVGKTVDSSWIWLFVLLGGTLFASALQRALIVQASYDSPFIINEKGNVKKIK